MELVHTGYIVLVKTIDLIKGIKTEVIHRVFPLGCYIVKTIDLIKGIKTHNTFLNQHHQYIVKTIDLIKGIKTLFQLFIILSTCRLKLLT